MIATYLVQGSVNAQVFEQWVNQMLFTSLSGRSILVMDSASFHRKQVIREMAKNHGHEVCFLPPYSPDLNKIEHDFATLKKIRAYHPALTLDEVIATYPFIPSHP